MLYLKSIVRHTLILSIAALPLNALAEAGKAIFVLGKAHIESPDGAKKALEKGITFESGDTIVTSARGQAQLRMNDGTLIAVRPDSRFVIEKFKYEKDKQSDESIYNLVKGGFRSITGKIGQENKKSYGVKTVVGTIGIRGTDFSAMLCDVDCGGNTAGLYVGVMDGGITVTNDSGAVSLDPGEYGYVQSVTSEPVYLDSAPGDLLFADTASGSTSTIADASTDTGIQIDTSLLETVLITEQPMLQPEILVASTGTYDLVTGSISDGPNTGSLSSGTMNVDFIAATVDTSFTGTVGDGFDNYTWNAVSSTGSLNMTTGQFSGALDGSVEGGSFTVVSAEQISGSYDGTLGSSLNADNVATSASYTYTANSLSFPTGVSGNADYALTSYTTQAQ